MRLLNTRFQRVLSGFFLSVWVVAASMLLMPAAVSAFTFEQGDVSGSLDMTLGYGTSFRVEKAAPYTSLGGGLYSNNEHPSASNVKSDREFGDYEFVSSIFRVLAELDLKCRNYGLKSTASYSYDAMILDRDRELAIDPSYGVPFSQSGWSDEAEDASGSVFELLDAYAYGTFFDGRIDLRVGKQVINWGEGLFFMDGVATQVPLNINKLVLPGSELKEAYIGIGAVRAQVAVTDKLSIDGYVQWEWEKNKFPGLGTFYGEDSIVAPGVQQESPFLFEEEHKADDNGQWGISTRYFFGDMELGLYYSRYHDAMPMINYNLLTGKLFESFAEDQSMYGASLSTTLGSWTMNVDASYRPDRTFATVIGGGPMGIGLNNDGKYWTEADTANVSVYSMWMGGDFIGGIDRQTVIVQLGMDYIDYHGDMANLQVQGSNHDANVNLGGGLMATKTGEEVTDTAWGIAAEYDVTWQAVVPNLDLTLELFGQYDFSGNSHFWGNFSEGRLRTSASLKANYGSSWETSLTYARMDYDESNYENQDTINFEINYKF